MATKNTKSYSENFIRIINSIPKNILPKSSEDKKQNQSYIHKTYKNRLPLYTTKRRHSHTLTFRRGYRKPRE